MPVTTLGPFVRKAHDWRCPDHIRKPVGSYFRINGELCVVAGEPFPGFQKTSVDPDGKCPSWSRPYTIAPDQSLKVRAPELCP